MTAVDAQAVVFLLDTSESMNESDPPKAAPDSVAVMAAALNPADSVGIICFNTESAVVRPLAPLGTEPPVLTDINYAGYTNTGAAASDALAMLEECPDKERRIVIVTDGEIMLPGADATLHSSQQFAADMERAAQSGIPVHILSLANGPSDRDYKLYAGYATWDTVPSDELILKSRELALQQFKPCSLEIPVAKETDTTGRILELKGANPLPGAQQITARITAANPGTITVNGTVSAPARSHIIDLDGTKTKWSIKADFPPDTRIKTDIRAKIDGRITGEAQKSRFSSAVDVLITPVRNAATEESFLDSPVFEGKTVRLKLNGEECTGTVANGSIKVQLPHAQGDSIRAEDIRFEDLGFSFTGENAAVIPIHRPGFLSLLLTLLGVGIIGWLYRSLRRKKEEPAQIVTAPPTAPRPTETKTTEKLIPPVSRPAADHYDGKLDIYVTAAPIDEDIPPLEYNLFRAGGKPITLADIMDGTGLKIKFPGAENIIFSPGKRSLDVDNRSDATLTKRGNIILKGRKTDLSYDERIHIAFADEKSEMIVIYKSLKP